MCPLILCIEVSVLGETLPVEGRGGNGRLVGMTGWWGVNIGAGVRGLGVGLLVGVGLIVGLGLAGIGVVLVLGGVVMGRGLGGRGVGLGVMVVLLFLDWPDRLRWRIPLTIVPCAMLFSLPVTRSVDRFLSYTCPSALMCLLA